MTRLREPRARSCARCWAQAVPAGRGVPRRTPGGDPAPGRCIRRRPSVDRAHQEARQAAEEVPALASTTGRGRSGPRSAPRRPRARRARAGSGTRRLGSRPRSRCRGRTGHGRPPRRCGRSGPTATTSAHTSRRSTLAVAGIRMPARDFRSPISSDGRTRIRSAVIGSSASRRHDRRPTARRGPEHHGLRCERGHQPRGYRRAVPTPPRVRWRMIERRAVRLDCATTSPPGAGVVGLRRPVATRHRRALTSAPTRRLPSGLLPAHEARVIELLLVTTVPAMILADDGVPSIGLVVAVLVGGALAAGGANTINCWIERDRDQVMRRTQHRPLPSGDIDPPTSAWSSGSRSRSSRSRCCG